MRKAVTKGPSHEGLDWGKIREEYAAKATPEELDGPFDEKGNLKGKAAHAINEEIKRKSRAKTDPTPPAASGAMARTTNKTTPEKVQEMIRLYKADATFPEIAKATGYHQGTVRRVLAKEGVLRPRRPGKRN